jgi:hypothetical protein
LSIYRSPAGRKSYPKNPRVGPPADDHLDYLGRDEVEAVLRDELGRAEAEISRLMPELMCGSSAITPQELDDRVALTRDPWEAGL